MEDETDSGDEGGILMLEGWMFGALYFQAAVAEVLRVPPANDTEAEPAGTR